MDNLSLWLASWFVVTALLHPRIDLWDLPSVGEFAPYLRHERLLRVALSLRATEVILHTQGPVRVSDEGVSAPLVWPASLAADGPHTFVCQPRQEEVGEETRYRLCLGLYPQRSRAESVAEEVQRRGLRTRVERIAGGFAVQVNDLTSRSWAETLCQRVRKAGYSEARVQSYSVPRTETRLAVRVDGQPLEVAGLLSLSVTPLTDQPLALTLRLAQGRVTGPKRYRGGFEVRAQPKQGLLVVNTVTLDDYLRGVVPLEMGPRTPWAALRAQAVAARTYALARLARQAAPTYDFIASHTQQYGGVAVETESTNRAVAETRGEVITFYGRLIHAFFHASCGGRTEDAANVWGVTEPCLVGVQDAPPVPRSSSVTRPAGGEGKEIAPVKGDRGWSVESLAEPEAIRDFLRRRGGSYCAHRPFYRWKVTYSRAELEERLRRTLPRVLHRPGLSLGGLKGVHVQARSVNGRVQVLEIADERHTYRIAGDRIRWLFGTGRPDERGLRSTLFVVGRVGERYHFWGGGWGHGVGMCQQGAQGLAEAGRDYRAILQHYYPGTQVERWTSQNESPAH
ncbi:MAG TPA: SpoIID/LytB domain-containing protein [Armatimonadetes bacterium]|nr:SpoIID/LytB domain-containing protein [Armatimonadota bacterium]